MFDVILLHVESYSNENIILFLLWYIYSAYKIILHKGYGQKCNADRVRILLKHKQL